MNGPTLLNLLRTGDIEPLHAHLTDLQAQFEAGQVADRQLLDTFQAFQTADLTLSPGFEAWTERYPDTYPLGVALGNWYLARGWDARGGAKSQFVSDQGWRALEHFLTQAESCARHAATLTEHPLAAWTIVGHADRSRGCQLSLDDVKAQNYPDWLTRGLKDRPSNYALRRIMLDYLRTEWGGSEEHMLTFVRQQQDDGQLSPADMQRLWAHFHANVSHHAIYFAQDSVQAVERAQMAAQLDPRQTAQLLAAQDAAGAPDSAKLETLRTYLTSMEREGLQPGGSDLHMATDDWAKPEQERLVKLAQRAAADGDADAAILLAVLRLQQPTLDLPDPRAQLEAAREQGHTGAAEMLVLLQETSMKGVLRTTPQKRDDIMKAAHLFSSDMNWRVFQDFDAYQKQFKLDSRDRFRYLHRAADTGNNDARFALSQYLRSGHVELGQDGMLRPVRSRPVQHSLDYARHLLEQAAAAEHKSAVKALRRASARDWQADTARQVKLGQLAAQAIDVKTSFWEGWWKWMVAAAILKIVAAVLGIH